MKRVLFVCLGNICRSPMAEGVFRRVAAERGLDLDIASAGTGAWHVGKPPDPRAIAAARERGIDISGQRARQVSAGDFSDFDLIVAMDEANLATLKRQAASHEHPRIRLFLEFASDAATREVPDPYYGGEDGFAHALDLIEAAASGLADHISGSNG